MLLAGHSIWEEPQIIVFAMTMIVGLLSTIVGAVIWLTRLEGRVNYESKTSDSRLTNLEKGEALIHRRIDETKAKHEEMEDRILQKMSAIEVSLAEISGYLRKQGEHV